MLGVDGQIEPLSDAGVQTGDVAAGVEGADAGVDRDEEYELVSHGQRCQLLQTETGSD